MELVAHALWECRLAQEVWSASAFGWLFSDVSSFLEMVDIILNRGRKVEIELFVSIVWAMSANRNKLVHGSISLLWFC